MPVKVTPSNDVLSREIQNETVLLDLKTEQYFGLDDVGSRVWQLIRDGVSLEEIVDRLHAQYDVDAASLRTDVERFVAQLSEAGLVSRTS